jgi:hypothetical protein
MQTNTATAPINADIELTRQLLAASFRPGVPSGLTVASQPIDQACCRRQRCPVCGRVGMDYLPHVKGNGYRLVAECPSCRHQEDW